MISGIRGAEGECVDQGLSVSGVQTPEQVSAKDALAANRNDEKQLKMGRLMNYCVHSNNWTGGRSG